MAATSIEAQQQANPWGRAAKIHAGPILVLSTLLSLPMTSEMDPIQSAAFGGSWALAGMFLMASGQKNIRFIDTPLDVIKNERKFLGQSLLIAGVVAAMFAAQSHSYRVEEARDAHIQSLPVIAAGSPITISAAEQAGCTARLSGRELALTHNGQEMRITCP